MGKFAEDLKKSLKEASEHARGKKELRTTVLAEPPKELTNDEIRSIREKLRVSQAVFARALNVSVRTYQAWEQGLRKPSGPSLKLLAIAKRHPEIVLR
ncbi:MAG: helix-turn-helix domain-containing protein [Acidobacteriota bacterium]|nr:MAG: helix-turn-helix domain-containing protein [Acidobacteriota bacterium]